MAATSKLRGIYPERETVPNCPLCPLCPQITARLSMAIRCTVSYWFPQKVQRHSVDTVRHDLCFFGIISYLVLLSRNFTMSCRCLMLSLLSPCTYSTLDIAELISKKFIKKKKIVIPLWIDGRTATVTGTNSSTQYHHRVSIIINIIIIIISSNKIAFTCAERLLLSRLH